MSITDFTIIGGGIIGLLTARELLIAGATVTLIEKQTTGQESSWAGGGILLPLYPWRQEAAISRLVIESHKLYPLLTEQLASDTGIDPQWYRSGLLITQNPDVTAAVDWCRQYQVSCQPAKADFFAKLAVSPNNPLWLPDIAQTRNPRLLKSLKEDLRNKGLNLIEHCQLLSIAQNEQHITSITTNLGEFAVKQLVMTTGAWTGGLFQNLFAVSEPAPNIAPIKGQMLLFAAPPELLNFIVLEHDQYLIPRLDGRILVGSTVEQDDFNKTTTAAAYKQLNEFALNLLPALKDCLLIKHWAGLRPGTQNGIPYIGKHPHIDNLSINAGHFRNGLAMGPASAQLLVDLLLNRDTSIAPEPYRIA